MADLTEIQASQSVKIAGAGPSTGVETNWMGVDANGTAQVGLYTAAGSVIDLNFGAASAATIRVAALLGNATGATDFNYGTVGAQTLRTASHIGNATGAANFGAGATGAQTLRTASNLYDGSANALTSQANGAQRALDVGIDVAGVQIDPRLVGFTRATLPADLTASTQQSPSLDNKGKAYTANEHVAYAKWGQAFALATGEITIAVTTEAPLLYIKNPNASGKIVRIKRFTFLAYSSGAGNNQNNVIYRIYINPTSSANGTAKAAVGSRQVGQAAAVSTSFTQPTITANGTLYATHKVNSAVLETVADYDLALIIDPNNTLLITAQLNTGGNPADVSVEFIEE